MRLHEEFKEYENLWEAVEPEAKSEFEKLMTSREGTTHFYSLSTDEQLAIIDAANLNDPVSEYLKYYEDFKFEYDGFDVEWSEDRWDYNTGHYDVGGTYYHPDFIYKVSAEEIYDTIFNVMLSKYPGKLAGSKLSADYNRLDKAYDTAPAETKDKAEEHYFLYLAIHLEHLEEIYHDELLKYYKEEAYEWAEDRW
jgi:hypothetical protein